MTNLEVRLLNSDDIDALAAVADGVFDGPVQPQLARAFLSDARHHLCVAIQDGVIVGMVSAVDYVHPDKARQLWINEVGVAPSHQRRGIGRRMMDAMLDHGRSLGCTEAWVATDSDNIPANNLYSSFGSSVESSVIHSFELSSGESRS